MSLDVMLYSDTPQIAEANTGIYVRRNGGTVCISREEWDAENPGREPVTVTAENIETNEVYSANITHNLGGMAEAAGIYMHLWRPEEIGITHAMQLVAPLAEGLARLKESPETYIQYNSPNGWGLYEHFVPFVENYLMACIANSRSTVRVSR